MKLQIKQVSHSKTLIILGITLITLLSIVSVNAATKSKKLSWSTTYGKASETLKFTVTLATINSPTVKGENCTGSGAYYGGLWYSYNSIKNEVTHKKVSNDTAKYTVTSTPYWMSMTNYNKVKGTPRTTNYKYSGSLTIY